MSGNQFLADKGLIQNGYSKFIIRMEDGTEIDLGKMLEEYAIIAVDKTKGYRTDVEYVPGQSFEEFINPTEKINIDFKNERP